MSYDWLLSITQQILPNQSFEERASQLIQALKVLIDERQILIGPAMLYEGKVHINHWGNNAAETISNVKKYISTNGEPGQNLNVAFGFWAGLPVPDPDCRPSSTI